jgi:hypothetical protein
VSIDISGMLQRTIASTDETTDISDMLQRMIVRVDVTADDRQSQDTDIVTTSFASGRT